MAKCNWGGNCNQTATTTLMKYNGEIVQFCERHRLAIINIAKRIAAGETGLSDIEHAEAKANHWLVKNKIPS